jgi:hypothetical protein
MQPTVQSCRGLWFWLFLSCVIHHPEPAAYHSNRKYARIFAFTPPIRLAADVLLCNPKQPAEH